MPEKTYEFTISGRVQGVGFRAFVQTIGSHLDLTGEVWNSRSGDVEGVVQGPEDAIEQFLSGMSRGPGRVDNVSKTENSGLVKFDRFSVSPSR